MKILAHRGKWKSNEEKNSITSLLNSFKFGMGVETDVRDCNGRIVISHDPPRDLISTSLDELLENMSTEDKNFFIALNIKSDGIQRSLLTLLNNHKINNFFVFDMAIPDMLEYRKLNIPYATRLSEYENPNDLTEDADWIWLDSFQKDWFDRNFLIAWLNKDKKIAVVSPELHGRSHTPVWEILKEFHNHPNLYLCTDLIEESERYFHENQY
ncbi:hypothetical protein [Limnobacter sp.]|uniref:hypothetical protein n=1 Tax=Limnobacter sp. TaxID=2003368 RepID=UPI002FE33881